MAIITSQKGVSTTPLFLVISRLMVMSRMIKKNTHVMTTESLFAHNKIYNNRKQN